MQTTQLSIPEIIRPKIFEQFPEIVAGQSTKLGGVSPEPYGMNLSSHVGDIDDNVQQNRALFYAKLGIPDGAKFVYQNQIHSSNVSVVYGGEGVVKENDALITPDANVVLGVTIADCTPVLLYDPVAKIIAAIHAGWRGTEQKIVRKTIQKMKERGSDPENIYAFIGASASGDKYEVGEEVARLFDTSYVRPTQNRKFLLDVKAANRGQLLEAGLSETQIETSPYCTMTESWLHSYRRDGKKSGRMLAIIGIKR